MRFLDAQSARDLALGAAVLGTGGGGDPYLGMLMALEAIRRHGPVRLIGLEELADDDHVAIVGGVGAPTVLVEKLSTFEEGVRVFRSLGRYLNRPLTAVMSAEIGGANSIVPMVVAALLDIPLVDADGMGRAYPEIPQLVLTLHGIAATPMAMTDEKGNSIILDAVGSEWAERFARSLAIDMGAECTVAAFPASGAQMRAAAVPQSVTRAEAIGRAIRLARANNQDPVAAILAETGGLRLFHGKITDVLRRTAQGFACGHATLAGLDRDAGTTMTLHFQNENLLALVNGEPVAVVPDLIVVLDADTGEPITTEHLRYGFRVEVIGIPCYHEWRTAEGLALGGPAHFGYDVEYFPVEQRPPRGA